jgi:superfamily II DNA or RNA helicase
MVEKLEHALCLQRELPEYSLCYSPQNGNIERLRSKGLVPDSFVKLDNKKVLLMRQEFRDGHLKRVISTGVWKRGVDFPHLKVLVRADGGASEILSTQIPGRVSRTAEDKDLGILIDLCDVFSPFYHNRSKTRRRHYKKKGWSERKWPEVNVLL